MATLTVTTASDVVDAGDGVLSLREAVAQSNATATADTINFASFIEGQTLTLTQGELQITPGRHHRRRRGQQRQPRDAQRWLDWNGADLEHRRTAAPMCR